ncbi:Tn7 transposase TnsA N-terminal domain-containing protein [Shewanella electrodiphila]|uniref:Tn7 transposase TnsA N-terminal domain-containing protein n=1 Tax=Shewanella electrodiphila TaxID=934143 RepID=A0ABT0KM68_9GAMM|nr:Tn7 transposase TnsA N-terminal domain-containing protein [Shewanella electrodiphila]MCL1044937.1 Tn7 transposase TnsA N-terminal domain-containing protein [Shewanella electrodiphila]
MAVKINARGFMGVKRSANIHRDRYVIRFYSKKSDCALQLETYLEWLLALRLETNPNVESYAAQPESMHLEILGKKCRYTPDFLVRYTDGSERYFEIHHEKFTTPEYRRRILDFNYYATSTTSVGIELIASKGIEEHEVEFHNLKLLADNYLLRPSFKPEQFTLPETITLGALIEELKAYTQYPSSEAYTLLTSGLYEYDNSICINANSVLQRVGS